MGDLFIDQLTRAIVRCMVGDGLPRVEDWPPDPAPAPEPPDALPLDAKLPPGVAWRRHTWIYAYCYVPDRVLHTSRKVVFSYLLPTVENAALAGRMAAAARKCRDAGGDADAVRAAGKGELGL